MAGPIWTFCLVCESPNYRQVSKRIGELSKTFGWCTLVFLICISSTACKDRFHHKKMSYYYTCGIKKYHCIIFYFCNSNVTQRHLFPSKSSSIVKLALTNQQRYTESACAAQIPNKTSTEVCTPGQWRRVTSRSRRCACPQSTWSVSRGTASSLPWRSWTRRG